MIRLARRARTEWGLLYVMVREPLLKLRLRAMPMTVTAVCLTALLQSAQSQSWGYRLVQSAGVVRARDALWLALRFLRLDGSTTSLSYGELSRATSRFANALDRLGVRAGGRSASCGRRADERRCTGSGRPVG